MLFKFLMICLIGVASCQIDMVDNPLPFNTTTPDPHTTTPAQTTTTPPQTTTPPETTTPPQTTTPATTTSTAAPTTAAPPTPAADVGTWNVTDSKTNVTCILATMAVQLSISYNVGVNKTAVAVLNIPGNTSTVTGTCGNDTQEMTISWKNSDASINSLVLVFSQNSTAKNYKIASVNVTIFPDNVSFPGATSNATMQLSAAAEDVLPNAPLAMSYRCTPAQAFNLTGNSTITLSKLQIQAFHTDATNQFGTVKDCDAQDSADIVPIAVGCALAALVVIVLIAYLIGRRRSHAKGYLSM